MKKRDILKILVLLVIFYPAYTLFRANEALGNVLAIEAENSITNYQISVWITWIVLVTVAVFYKWTQKRNYFFFFTYGFLFVTFSILGYLHQEMVNIFDLPSPFRDSYTLGVLTAIQNILVSSILTGFLHAGVWWFTRRWHRR
ncbi:hypothetical protein [Salinimicrobium flavum]|uniref:VanZ like family protein n=1 Tax=Salinimicrobium flavum TaxID=1737065 RepID=A0ABW5J033_9FLAO